MTNDKHSIVKYMNIGQGNVLDYFKRALNIDVLQRECTVDANEVFRSLSEDATLINLFSSINPEIRTSSVNIENVTSAYASMIVYLNFNMLINDKYRSIASFDIIVNEEDLKAYLAEFKHLISPEQYERLAKVVTRPEVTTEESSLISIGEEEEVGADSLGISVLQEMAKTIDEFFFKKKKDCMLEQLNIHNEKANGMGLIESAEYQTIADRASDFLNNLTANNEEQILGFLNRISFSNSGDYTEEAKDFSIFAENTPEPLRAETLINIQNFCNLTISSSNSDLRASCTTQLTQRYDTLTSELKEKVVKMQVYERDISTEQQVEGSTSPAFPSREWCIENFWSNQFDTSPSDILSTQSTRKIRGEAKLSTDYNAWTGGDKMDFKNSDKYIYIETSCDNLMGSELIDVQDDKCYSKGGIAKTYEMQQKIKVVISENMLGVCSPVYSELLRETEFYNGTEIADLLDATIIPTDPE